MAEEEDKVLDYATPEPPTALHMRDSVEYYREPPDVVGISAGLIVVLLMGLVSGFLICTGMVKLP